MKDREVAIENAISLVRPQLADAEKSLRVLVAFASRGADTERKRTFLGGVAGVTPLLKRVVISRMRRQLAEKEILSRELSALEKQLKRENTGTKFPSAKTSVKLSPPVKGKRVTPMGIASVRGLRVYRSGIRYQVKKGRKVVAPGAGKIVFRGVVRGDDLLLIEHSGSGQRIWSLLAGVESGLVTGDQVERGMPVGTASKETVEWQRRMEGWPGGIPLKGQSSGKRPNQKQ